jgi:ABC-2 type transport system permease protein
LRREVAAVFEIDADYLNTGKITAITRDSGLFSQQGDQRRQTQVADAIRASLMHQSMSGSALTRAYAPASNVERRHLTAAGTIEALSDPYGLGPLAGSFGVVLLLTMSIFVSAAFLQQATIADRQNRMIEVLVSSVDSDQLLAGKLLGLGGAGLLQVAIYVALILVPGATLFSVFQVPIARLLLSLVYYVIGVTLFASLTLGTGMLGRSAQESAQLSALWTMSSAVPMMFIANVGTAPNGAVARALSVFPLTSPVAMIMRIGGGEVPIGDIVASLAIDVAAIYFVLRAASKIFRTATLMQGKRATLPEFMRWVRAA